MKKRTQIIIGLGVLCLGTLIIGACSSDQSPYEDYAKQGKDFAVCYDLNGGKASKADKIVNIYRSEQVKAGIKLYAPNVTAGDVSHNVERTGYFLAGWYRVRSGRVNDAGEPLDEEGNVCNVETDLLDEDNNPVYDENGNIQKTYVSEYGKAQGYSYSEKWNFNDILQMDDFVYEKGKYALTLYAAWVPNFTYEVNGQQHEWKCVACDTVQFSDEKPEKCTGKIENEEGETVDCPSVNFNDEGNVWHAVATRTIPVTVENGVPHLSAESNEIGIPTWNNETGGLDYGDFSQPSGLTFRAVYATGEDCEAERSPLSSISHHGTWDEETATATGNVARYYASWENGVWYRIQNKEQLVANANGSYSYHLLADLDFSGTEWPKAFSQYEYRGTFDGGNHTISNVTVVQDTDTDTYGGLFGAIGEAAAFENITFSSVTFNLNAASTVAGSMFGLFAGRLSEKAKITNVKVSGVFSVGDGAYVPAAQWDPLDSVWRERPCPYSAGLLTGNLVSGGISFADIELKTGAKKAEVKDPLTGEIKIQN